MKTSVPPWLSRVVRWGGAFFFWICASVLVFFASRMLASGKMDAGIAGLTALFCGLALGFTWLGWRALVPAAESTFYNTSYNLVSAFSSRALNELGKDRPLDRVREEVHATLTRPDLSAESKAELLDGLASIVLYQRVRVHLPQAVHWARQAVAFTPNRETVKGTLGSLLVELGQYDEGQTLLQEVYERSEQPIDRGISALYLAIAARHRTDLEAVQIWSKRARDHYPDEWLITRLKEERIL